MKLHDIAHSRTGDKGDTSTISVIVYDAADFPRLDAWLTADRVAIRFAGIIDGPVDRYRLPTLGALNFVLHRALGGGVTRSLRLDQHGKSLSSWLLDMDLPESDDA
ncbi:hypothetical protein [Tistrella mobilis]|uniref:AtuA-like ferredoxin-fold domain-containing protein n=1 Tax=Tistrella mobilis (strain KA081020-065) TaxID=1110502 RepID=I3TUE7_TISMK|nr:hypothetical protein [Tistrella mobilis]AFK56385.1 hypothetical protein TMO_b0377 [Tistrella mobilis KA081020-065]